MQQETQWISRGRVIGLFVFLTLTMTAVGCSAPAKKRESAPPKQQVFHQSFGEVWRSAQLALSKYPIQVNDMDSGILETNYIRGNLAWISPPKTKAPPGGYRYKISIRVIKGWIKKNLKPVVKVTVLKQAELKKNFFSAFSKVPSDGLEELSVLYRMRRELQIQNALRKVKR